MADVREGYKVYSGAIQSVFDDVLELMCLYLRLSVFTVMQEQEVESILRGGL